MKLFLLATLFLGLCVAIADAQWQQQTINTDANFRGLCAVSPKVAWVSGTKGTYGRTIDAGKTWSVGTVPDAEKLDFRDVKAFSETTAYLLSAGPGEDSRIYKTVDGGKKWELQFKNSDKEAFFDAIAFWDEKNGIALSDPVKGQFQLIVTDDGGKNWKPLPSKNLPAALPKEGAFAASGTCLVTHGENDVWFCTGGAKTARVFHSTNRGQDWTVSETPIMAGVDSAGIFSIAFRDRDHGMIVGGDYRKPNDTGATAASTADGGKTWVLIDKPFPYRSGVAWAKDRWVAVGTSGSHFSEDNGATWKPLDRENYNSVGFTSTGEGWAVGPKGRIAKFADAPNVFKAESLPDWDAKFGGKEGWIGGDGVYSVVLGPKRVVFLFGDTLLGTVKDGKRTGAVMVNNTVAVLAGQRNDAAIRFVAGKGKDEKAAAVFIPEDGKGWYWPQAGVRMGERLFVFLPQIEKTKDGGPFGFKQIGQGLATVENPDDEPEKWRVKQDKVPFADFSKDRQRSWGSALLADGDYLYIYGFDEARGKGVLKRSLTVARVPAEKLGDFTAWRFRTADGWSDKPADAAPLADGLATEFSVCRAPGGKGFVTVYTENGLGDRIVSRFASAPEGPWSDAVLLYKCPEMAKDKGVFSYAAKAHPWASGENELIVSYCVNAWEFARLFREDQVYRPKFVRVQFK